MCAEVRLPGAKRARYEVSDRFYNIYYLLRFSRTGRNRLERLVTFLHDLFGPAGMRTMYPAALAALRADGVGTTALSEWLAFWLPTSLVTHTSKGAKIGSVKRSPLFADRVGPNAPIIQTIREEFADNEQAKESHIEEWMKRAGEFYQAGCFEDAEAAFRNALAIQPGNIRARLGLSSALANQHRFEEAGDVLDCVLERASTETPEKLLRIVTYTTLLLKGTALLELQQLEDAIPIFRQVSEYVDPDDSTEVRGAAAMASGLSGNYLAELGREEEAIAAWQRASEHIRTDDPPELRHTVAKAIAAKGLILGKLGRDEDAINAREQVARYVRPDDSEELRLSAVNALAANGSDLTSRSKYKEAAGSWERVSEYIREEDSVTMRHLAVGAASLRGVVLSELGNHDFLIAACRLAGEYVHRDDPIELRRLTAKMLALVAANLSLQERYGETESVCRMATDIDPDCDEFWIAWAQAILNQNDPERLQEAHEHASRAVKFAPKNPDALRTLSNVLAGRGKWTEALGKLEHALRITKSDSQKQEVTGLTEFFIRAVTAGHGRRVMEMMEAAGLAKSMEPLWHAIRAELGEELEPLPTEIMIAVTEIRQRFSATNSGSQP